MRILQLINRVPWPLKDGGSIGYYNFIKGYHDAGCSVDVAALNTSKHYVNMQAIPPDLSAIADWHTVNIDNRVKVVDAFLNLFSTKSYHVERFISTEFEGMLTQLLQAKQFDVVIFESLFTTPYINVVRNNSKALLVLRHHNVEHEIWESLALQTRNPVKKWYVSLLAKRLKKFEFKQLNVVDISTCVTQQDAETFRGMGCTIPIHVIPASVDNHLLEIPLQKIETPSLFHIGSMEWEPNVHAMRWFIDEVWKQLSVQFPSLQFHIAGRGMSDAFKQLTAPNLVIEGEVEDAVLFMRSKQIMVVPLFSGSGIRVKILEGMALGKAIVATSLGAQGIACEHNKNILIANTADEFCQCIGQLLNNPVLCETLGKEARKLVVEKYSNTKIAADVLTFYRQQSKHKGV
ncbi:MAG: glycosyltransferase family 4 protein [Bacteroidota bacterium]